MEIHQLRYFVAVARTRNFSHAAAQCHVSQPSLSQQIQKLESGLGERLFNRLPRKACLTAHGELFLPRAIRVLEEIEAAKREAADARSLHCGTLSIGVLPTLAPYLLPDAMEKFREAFPGVEIIIHEDTTARLLELATRYEIDIALASRPVSDERLAISDLFEEELLLAVCAGHPLVHRKSVTVANLAEESLIVLKESHCLGDQVLGFCDRENVHPKISFRSSQLETIRELVSRGLGISLIPAMATRSRSHNNPVYRSLNAPVPSRTIVALWPKQRPPGRAGNEFLKLLQRKPE